MARGASSGHGRSRDVDRAADARRQGLRLELRHTDARYRAAGRAAAQPLPDRLPAIGPRDRATAAAQHRSLPSSAGATLESATDARSLAQPGRILAAKLEATPEAVAKMRQEKVTLLLSVGRD